MKILIIHTYGMGDLILFTPIYQKLCEVYPDAKFDFFITQKSSIKPLENHSQIGKIFHSLPKANELFLIGLKLRKKQYDISISTSGGSVWKATLFSWLVYAKIRVGEVNKNGLNMYIIQI
jgi:ADP-heptose:LPS heptosyltransferase